MQNIKCKQGKCWDDDSVKRKIRSNCDSEDIACQTEADLLDEEIEE